MRLVQRMRCLVGGHIRSREHLDLLPDGSAKSICNGCARPMARDLAGEWRVI